jgi:hypothetical protein
VAGVLFGITVWNVLFWIPSFLLDWFLYQKVPDGTLTALNIGVTIFILYAIVRIGKVLAARREAKLEAEAAALEARELAFMNGGGAVAPSDGAVDAPLLGRA